MTWSRKVWIAPPNWPQPPAGFVPAPGWEPDPAWPPPPNGWQFWQDASSEQAVQPALTNVPAAHVENPGFLEHLREARAEHHQQALAHRHAKAYEHEKHDYERRLHQW